MTIIRWLEQRVSDLPCSEGWLSDAEASVAGAMQVEKRRNDWILGRWTAKLAVTAYLRLEATEGNLARVEILPGSDGAPLVRLDGTAAPVALSISHSDRTAMCAVTAAGNCVGCDIERMEVRSERFVEDYFTAEERQLIRDSFPLLASVLWSAKESVLKLLHTGLRLDTRDVCVSLGKADGVDRWWPFHATLAEERTFRGWWSTSDHMVRTVAAFPPAAAVAPLRSAAVSRDAEDFTSALVPVLATGRSSWG